LSAVSTRPLQKRKERGTPGLGGQTIPDILGGERWATRPAAEVNPDTNETLCISCDLCALACPENLIVVTSERNEKTRRKELTNFTYDLSRCMF
jgi:formate hydrogenlyase subunit 6/NADH:ubiquinone oxidoreductase subunit I